MTRYGILRSLLALALIASSGGAQPIPTESGPIEFIGLRSCSPQELWRRIHALSPGKGAHACGAVLKQQLHFAEASVFAYPNPEATSDERYTWVVTVIEGEDSARVRYRTAPASRAPTIRQWASFGRLMLTPNVTMQAALSGYPKMRDGDTDGAMMAVRDFGRELQEFTPLRVDMKGVRTIWRSLERQRAPAAMERAIRTLARDGNDTNRAAAVVVLMNFTEDDRAICAVMDACIDPNPTVSSVAGSVLQASLVDSTRTVDWTGAAGSLRTILGGTNLFALLPTMVMLKTTHVSPALAAPLLGDNGTLILAYARAYHDDERLAARALLRQLAGRDLGDDITAWERWIAGLGGASTSPGDGADNRGH